MKRLFLLIVLVMMVSWIVRSHRSPMRRASGPPGHWTTERRNAQRALTEARNEVRETLAEARDEVRQAVDEARDEVHQALAEVRVAFVSSDEPARPAPPVPPRPPEAIEEVAGLPVPIVPGTRVTKAEAMPPVPRTLAIAAVPASPTEHTQWNLTGRLSATADRAVADARLKLRDEVATWLDPEVPRSWTPSVRLVDAMLVGEPRIKTIQKDYGEVFEATLAVDASRERRTALIEVYNRQLVERRLATLGATLAFVLICLAAVSGYIRADEATKGYYTNRLRMLAAAGVGASGVIIYHMIA